MLSAFVNALTLVVLSIWILYEAVLRLRAPEAVNETTMIGVAALGLVLNGGIMLALRAASRDDINVRSAFVHMLGDALGSVAIIGGAMVIRYTGWVQVDPILSILIALLIIWTAWDIIRESLNILLEGLPRGIHLADVAQAMGSVEGVLGVHDLHIWSLGSSTHALSCHVLIEDVPPSASDVILRSLNGAAGPAVRHRPHHRTVRTRELLDFGEWLRDSGKRAARARLIPTNINRRNRAMPLKHESLAQITLFAGFERKRVHALSQRAVERRFGPEEMLFWEGEPCTGIFLLTRGASRFSRPRRPGAR